MAFLPSSTLRIAPPRHPTSPHLCPARPAPRLTSTPPTATTRPLRASTVAAVVPVLASRRQLFSRMGSASAVLDRVFFSLLFLLLLHLFPIFPSPLSSLLRVLLLAGPITIPWLRATRANASLRRQGRFLLLSGPLQATRVGENHMRVQIRCRDTGLTAVKNVSLREPLLGRTINAHALCTIKGDNVNPLEILVRGSRLVGSDAVKENVLNRICRADAQG